MACGFCESTLSNCMGTLLADCVAKPIGHQINYIRRFHNNVEMLMERKDELIVARSRLQHEIEDAERELQGIEDDVKFLLSKTDKILSGIESLENEMQQNKRCFNWCPNWSWRYRLSKKAMKNTLVICEHIEKITKFGQLGRVGYLSTSTVPTIEFFSSKDFMVSNSSNIAFNHIIEALKDDNVSMIGLCGMGGVGKTTLVREVGNQVKKLHLFDNVVITTVSQKPNFETIQDEIAKYIDFNMKSERGRRSTQELWLKLQKEKRILIILDDVWARIDLKEKIGIPFAEDHKGCKILLTTRRQQVCDAMECQKAISLGCLNQYEAWTLFTKKAGLNDSSNDAIKDVATKVVKKCDGLPIAIVTLGSALKGKSRHRWEAAYRRLKNRRLVDIEDIYQQNAYQCLEVSFDYLKDTETKICFLLCSLFPEDYEIPVEDLVRYAWGLELYKGMDSIEEGRSEVLAAIDILKDSALLLNVGERHVKMHDMVRDVALWIASHKKEISFVIKSDVVKIWPNDECLEPYVAISFNTSPIGKLPEGLVFPNLKILLLGGDGRNMITSSEFFEGMEVLKVCALHYRLISPDAFQFQMHLRTLHLKRCKLLEISSLGKLKKLEVLSFSLSNINELPDEIGDLNNLKLLDLSYCAELKKIPSQLIRRLSRLEELYLHGCGLIKWATKKTIQEQSSASLSELNSLSNLTVLSLETSLEYLPRDFVFCKLQRFYVCVDEEVLRARYFYPFDEKFLDICTFSRSLEIEASALKACKQLIADTEFLNLKNVLGCQNLVPSLELDHVVFNKLTSLGLASCEHMKCLIDTTTQQAQTIAFSNLLELSLKDMVGLEELCSGHQPQGFLVKLKTLLIHQCEEMICAVPILQNLERLEVGYCEKMEVLFQVAELRRIQEGPSHPVSLQSLKLLKIRGCNKLRYLFPASVAESLGQLETLDISACLELEEIIPKMEMANISLQSLREVVVRGCNNLISLSSLSHGRSLENLTTLGISYCDRLVYTFPISMAEGLPQLNVVELKYLPRFEGRDGNDVVLTLPSLRKLTVEKCAELTAVNISAKIEEFRFVGMAQKKQMMAPELEERASNMEYLTITTSEKLFDAPYNLSCLKVLWLDNLPQLRMLWKGPIQVENFQNLIRLEIYSCIRLRYIFSAAMARNLPQLSFLWIQGCEELEGITEKDDQTSSQHHHHQTICFPNLTEIRIGRCNSLKSLFPISVAHGLPKLQDLTVKYSSKLEQIFEQGDEANVSNDEEKVIQLPQLTTLNLTMLLSLVSFIPVGYHFVLPSLGWLDVESCPHIRTSFRVDDVRPIGHAKTEDRSIVELEVSATAQQTTWPIGHNIFWTKNGS